MKFQKVSPLVVYLLLAGPDAYTSATNLPFEQDIQTLDSAKALSDQVKEAILKKAEGQQPTDEKKEEAVDKVTEEKDEKQEDKAPENKEIGGEGKVPEVKDEEVEKKDEQKDDLVLVNGNPFDPFTNSTTDQKPKSNNAESILSNGLDKSSFAVRSDPHSKKEDPKSKKEDLELISETKKGSQKLQSDSSDSDTTKYYSLKQPDTSEFSETQLNDFESPSGEFSYDQYYYDGPSFMSYSPEYEGSYYTDLSEYSDTNEYPENDYGYHSFERPSSSFRGRDLQQDLSQRKRSDDCPNGGCRARVLNISGQLLIFEEAGSYRGRSGRRHEDEEIVEKAIKDSIERYVRENDDREPGKFYDTRDQHYDDNKGDNFDGESSELGHCEGAGGCAGH